MVYYLSCNSGSPVINDPRPSPLTQMEYADPAQVHPTSLDANTVQMKEGYRVKPESAPKGILWESDPSELPDVIANQQVLATCNRFRDLVERYEPGVHQFIPVDVFTRGINHPISKYYWFVVCQRLDSVDPEHTTYEWKLDHTGKSGFWSKKGVENPKLIFSERKVAGHHIWADPHLAVFKSGLCSSLFGAAALAEGFSGLNVTARETV